MFTCIGRSTRQLFCNTILLSAVGVIVFSGCSKTPTEEEGRNIVQEFEIKLTGDGFIKMDKFKKIDGQLGEKQNSNGIMVQSYSLKYDAEIEAVKLCVLRLQDGSIYFEEEKNLFGPEIDLPPGKIESALGGVRNIIKMNPTQRCIISGTVFYEKTDKGWKFDKDRVDFLDTDRDL